MMADYNSKNGGKYENTPVVSAICGEASSLKQYQHNYDFLNRFDKIYICPDKDTKGEEALHKIAKVLPRDKLYVIELPLKDANDMLTKGREQDFISRFFKAPHYSPAGILGSDTIYEKIVDRSLVPKLRLPEFLNGANEMLRGGIPEGSIVNIMAGSGAGKTTLINEIVIEIIENKTRKLGVLTLEADAGEYGENLLSRKIGQKLSLFDDPIAKHEFITSDHVKQTALELFNNPDGTPSFYLIDDRGDFGAIEGKIEELIISCNVDTIIIDVLTDIFAGEGLDYQQKFMKWQKSTVKAYPGLIFINIIHSRKGGSGQQTASNGATLSEEDMTGSASQYQSGSINLVLARDKVNADPLERNTTYVHLTKNRHAGETGLACKLYYENETHTYHDFNVYKANNLEKFVGEF